MYIVQTDVITVGNNCLTKRLKFRKIIHHCAAKKSRAILECWFIYDNLRTFGFDALHNALDRTLTKIIRVRLHGEAINTNHALLFRCSIVFISFAIVIISCHMEHTIGNEIFSGAVALHNGFNQVFRYILIICQQLFRIFRQAIAAIAKAGIVIKISDPRVKAHAFNDLLGVQALHLGIGMGNIISESYKLMVAIQPDAVLVLGDTNSCLSVIGAKRLHIPIFHMEAGNRCKDECLPEETNRRIVDIISDVNMAYSEHARRYLADTGLPKERTYVTGSPMAEVLHQNLEKIEASDIHARLGLEKGKYILLSAHREENIDTEKNFTSLFTAINKMAEKYDMPILYSCHPRSRKRLEQSGFQLDKRVIQHEPLGFHDYTAFPTCDNAGWPKSLYISFPIFSISVEESFLPIYSPFLFQISHQITFEATHL